MDISLASDISKDPVSRSLVEFLELNQADLGLQDANLYYNFPLYRDEEIGGLVSTKVLLVSPSYGVFVLGVSNANDGSLEDLSEERDSLDHVFSHVYSRLLKNRKLRESKQSVVVPLRSGIYAPNLTKIPDSWDEETTMLTSQRAISDFVRSNRWNPSDDVFSEAVSTIEGAKGLIRPTKRAIEGLPAHSKGRLASQLEAEITTFDLRQKQGSIIKFDGPQRIRGLAGSGKTVVLAMKAALIHLREPNAKILYAFWTKSLYQHVRRLITRFYRQFEDRDPDWKLLQVMHGWGGASLDGVYYTAAKSAGIRPLTFQEASNANRSEPFGYACSQLLKHPLKPLYDYIFIDEGQDYPTSFVQLCAKIVEGDKFVIAYDELQNIFQTNSPSAAEIFGLSDAGAPQKEFVEDIVLHKCYRNPREVLVNAHAAGFGIYSSHIVQMLENKEHWEDIGYSVIKGDFTQGSDTVIERPMENSLSAISQTQNIDEIVSVKSFVSVEDEVLWVVNGISEDVKEGLNPEDILVVTLDDRNAKLYLTFIAAELRKLNIQTHNVHVQFGETDFHSDGSVTLSTVHKAKGNEAMIVYVVGVDALYQPKPTIRQRNMLFAAMTRAKGWLRVTGISPGADAYAAEIKKAKANFPRLVFTYPSPAQLKVMRRDLEDSADRRLRAERILEEIAGEMSPEEIADLLRSLTAVGGKSKSKGRTKK